MQPMAATGHSFHFGPGKQPENDLPVLFKDVIGLTPFDKQHWPSIGVLSQGGGAHCLVARFDTLQVKAPAVNAPGVALQAHQQELYDALLLNMCRH